MRNNFLHARRHRRQPSPTDSEIIDLTSGSDSPTPQINRTVFNWIQAKQVYRTEEQWHEYILQHPHSVRIVANDTEYMELFGTTYAVHKLINHKNWAFTKKGSFAEADGYTHFQFHQNCDYIVPALMSVVGYHAVAVYLAGAQYYDCCPATTADEYRDNMALQPHTCKFCLGQMARRTVTLS